jgi:hypothetical protein
MLLTQTEAALAALLVAFIAGVVVPIWTHRRYMTCEDCDKRHATERTACDKRHVSDKEALRVVYRMVRALVVHSSMTAEEKEKVLNDRGMDT